MAAPAFKIHLSNQLAAISEALEALGGGLEVKYNRDGSVGLTLTASMEETLNIRPISGGVVPYQARPFQRVLNTLIEMLWISGVPIRFIILKSRQLGCTTHIQGVIHDLTRRIPGISARTIAHKRPDARRIHEMQQRFHYNCPEKFRRPLETGKIHKDRLKYSFPHESDIAVYTAAGGEIGRGHTNVLDHWTEFAFWPDAADRFNDLIHSIHDVARTMVIMESTANGKNFFHQLWQQAHDPDSIWIPIFISWLEDPKAWMEFGSEKQKEEFVASYSAEESDYALKWHLEPERMKWVRYTIQNKCRGSWDKYHQEYPIDPSVAFIFSGWPWFNQQVIGNLITAAQNRSLAFRGDIQWAGKKSTRTKLNEGDYGPLMLWWSKEADPSSDFSLGVDVAEGVNADYSEIVVIQHDPLRVVGHYRANDEQRGKPSIVGIKSMMIGALFNWGLLGIESNSSGHTALDKCQRGDSAYPQLRQYPNLYYHLHTDRKILEESQRAGWPTNVRTKKAMLERLAETIYNEDMDIPSMPLLLQMNEFNWDPIRRTWGQGYVDPHSKLANDDGVMALAIANEMRIATENNLLAQGLHMKRAGY